VRHRRLSAELKRLREAAGVSTEAAGEAIGAFRTKIHRIERGEWRRLRESDIRRLASLYGVDKTREEALVAMAKEASRLGWWARYTDVLGPGSYTSLEASASSVRFYSGMLIPGLLQTAGYAEAVFKGWGIDDPDEVQRRLEARRERQRLIEQQERPAVEAIIDQAALNKLIGSPATMAEQLLHLINTMEREKAEILVLPDEAGAHAALTGQFAIIEFSASPDATITEDPVVFIDSAHNGLFLEEHEEVASYLGIYDKLRTSALDSGESRRFISRLANNLI